MHRVLFTGMSGTGKSTVLAALRAEENVVVDLDDSWIIQDAALGEGMIDIERVLALFRSCPEKDVFLAGCAINQGQLYPHLTAVITLTAPADIMRRRIEKRTHNPFGKDAQEWAQILRDKAEIEPLLMRASDWVCDTGRDFSEVMEDIRRFLNREKKEDENT